MFEFWIKMNWGNNSKEIKKYFGSSISKSKEDYSMPWDVSITKTILDISPKICEVLNINDKKYKFKFLNIYNEQPPEYTKIATILNIPPDTVGFILLYEGAKILSILGGYSISEKNANLDGFIFKDVYGKYKLPFAKVLKKPAIPEGLKVIKHAIAPSSPKKEKEIETDPKDLAAQVPLKEVNPKVLYHFTNPKSLLLILDSGMLRGSFNYEVDVDMERRKWTYGAYISTTTSKDLGTKSSAGGADDSTLGGTSCMMELIPSKIKFPMYKYKSSMVDFSENEVRILTGSTTDYKSGIKNIKNVIKEIVINESGLITELKTTRWDEQYAENTRGFDKKYPKLAGKYSKKVLTKFYEILDDFGVKYKVV